MRNAKFLLAPLALAFFVLFLPGKLFAAEPQLSQSAAPPLTQAQQDYLASLDKLLAEHNTNDLKTRMVNPPDNSYVVPILDWAKERMMAGASVAVPLIYADLLWGIGSTYQQHANLKETAALITLYVLLVMRADGLKCADVSAPGHRISTLTMGYREVLSFLSQLPEDKRNLYVNTAIGMEKQTAPVRGDDNYLCRGGMAEMRYSMEKYGSGKEQPSQPGQLGKNYVVQTDPNYSPQFLPREQWEPKQTAMREKFATEMPALLDALKNAPARPSSSQPSATKKP